MKHPVTIIYHGNCPDGFGAALAAYLYFNQQASYKTIKKHIIYYKGKHGNAPPECINHDVYILDFSYSRDHMQALCHRAHKVILIDHHISAYNELKDLDQEFNNLTLLFDMQQSGAVLSWQYFHNSPTPELLLHIQDNDLWQFKLDNTRTILSAIMSYPMKMRLWNSWLNDKQALEKLHAEGLILERQITRQIKHYKRAARMGKIAGYTVPVVNAPSSIGSELLHQLSEGHPFAAAYEDKPERRTWQLRSGGEQAIDVSEIARLFGGGGHKNASGFSTENFTIELTTSQQTHLKKHEVP